MTQDHRKPVRIVASLHPLKIDREVSIADPGQSVSEIVEAKHLPAVYRDHAVVTIDGEIVPQKWWPLVKPKGGTSLSIRVVPRGGLGRAILSLAVLVVAIAIPAILPGVVGFLSTGLGVSAAIAGTILTTVTATVGMLLVNAIAPVQSARATAASTQAATQNAIARDDPLFSLTGGNNQQTPWQPLPMVFGRVRAYPPLGAQYYTEIIGNEQYLRMLVCWGYGPLDISDLKIGETPLSSFQDVQIETQSGYSTSEKITLYPETVVETSLSIALAETDGYQTKTTGTGVDQVGIDLVFPRGLVFIDNTNGNKNSQQVLFAIEYRTAGSGSWSSISAAPNVVSSFSYPDGLAAAEAAAGGIPISGANTENVRVGFRWDVTRGGAYDVRVRRITADTDDISISDIAAWSAIRTFTNEDPLAFPVPVAKTAIIIRASDQLNGTVDQLNGIVTMIAPDWDGSAWTTQATTSPAAAMRRVLQGPGTIDPQADGAVDLDALADWAEFCTAKGLSFNEYRTNEASIWDTLSDICAAGRASPALKNGLWRAIWDFEQDTPVQYFTPRNSFNFKGEKLFLAVPHAYRVQFANEDNGYKADERIVYRTGYDASTATLFEQMSPTGITNSDQVFRHANFAFAQALLRPERWTFDADWEVIECARGDLVNITHDILSIGLGSGRVKTLTHSDPDDDTSDIVSITTDEYFTPEDGKSYAISVRSVSDVLHTHALTTVAGRTNSLTLAAAVAAGTIEVDDLVGFGIAGSVSDEALVTKVSPNADHGATVSCIPYSRSIYTSDDGDIPAYVPVITLQDPIPTPTITDVISDERLLLLTTDGRVVIRCQVIAKPIALPGALLEVQTRISGTNGPYLPISIDTRTGPSVIFQGVNQGESYDIRARWLVGTRFPGPWSYSPGHQIVGKSSPPAALTGLTISISGGNVIMRWERPSELDVRIGGVVRFRHSYKTSGAEWSDTVSIAQSVAAANCTAVLPLKAGTYFARVYDSSGIPSLTASSITSKQATVESFSELYSISEAPDFAGVKTNVAIDATGPDLHLSGVGLVDDIPDFDAISSLDAFGGIVASGTYIFDNDIDLGDVMKVRLTSVIESLIVNVNDRIDDRAVMIDRWEDFDGTGSASADIIIQERHTDDDPGGSPTYGPWQQLESGEFEARGFQFQALFSSSDAAYDIRATDLAVRADELS